MASQESEFFKKMAAKATTAHKKAAQREVQYDTNGDLPPMEGIAQLVDIKIGTHKDGDNKGKFFFNAQGVVVSPTHVISNGSRVKVQGRRTSVIIPLYDTPNRKTKKTFEDHWLDCVNELKKLGADVSDKFSDVEASLKALRQTKPYFEFRVWVGRATKEYPNPRANHVWNGAVEYTPEAGDEGGEVYADDDTTAPADEDLPAEDDDQNEGDTDAPADDETPEPASGEIWLYKYPGAKKAEECEVTRIYASKRQADLKLVADGRKVFKLVPWDKLSLPG